MLSFIVLYLIAYWLFTSWLRLPSRKSVATVQPMTHTSLVVQQSQRLCAYADFVNDCDDLEFIIEYQ